MFRRKKLIRHIALFLIIHTLYFTFLPTLSYALTSGPTSPEASSFEPVDTTDMVNLLTGDFTYNIPLMEVPGPAGGYPITLAYHAGIQPNQDASWVGLGWSLNPGAINRLVNGYADDHRNVKDVDRVYWEGGNRTTNKIGFSVGIANVASVGAGLSYGNDTYKGYGAGFYAGAGIGLNLGGNFNLGLYGETGNTPFGGGYNSIGIGLGVGTSQGTALNLGAHIGVNYNSVSGINVGAAGGINSGIAGVSGSLLGVSIQTNGSGPALTVGGGSSKSYNNKSDNISTISRSWLFDIPIFYGINLRLGRDYHRYWVDETANIYTNGSLYFPSSTIIDANYLDNNAFDTYDLLDMDIDIVDHADAQKVLGGSFPDYDQYIVVAQGLGGSIRPYHFQKNLFRQNKKENNRHSIKSFSLDGPDKPVEFRFINDFSNRFEYDPQEFEETESKPLTLAFDNLAITGETGTDGYINNHLAGSRHIKHFTNRQVLSGEAKTMGFIDNQAAGFLRDNNLQIGGFMITNESGVTYHFSLPAYSFDEYMKSENTEEYKHTEGDIFNELSKPGKYAYTWFLTAVTGPDFVDKNDNGLVDDGDLGYWVGFEYGKWTDNYWWRNPGEGYHKDLDQKFQNFSSGKKELYYLDAIITASHTAVFVKKIRNDGKGVTSLNGGYRPIKNEDGTVETFPVSTLALKEILLFKNTDFDFWSLYNKRAEGMDYNESYENCMCCSPHDQLCIFPDRTFGNCEEREECDSRSKTIRVNIESHMGQNIIDETDFSDGETFRKILRGVSFETDYSLCRNTPNSYHSSYSYVGGAFFPSLSITGKLTLKALHFLGKEGVSIMPPTNFTYDKNPDYNKDAYDIWGYYKSDYVYMENENLARIVSSASAENVDAWSLSKINTSVGGEIKVEYESDTYKKPELHLSSILSVSELIPLEEYGMIKIKFHNIQESLNLIFNQESKIRLKGVLMFPYTDYEGSGDEFDYCFIRSYKTFENEVIERGEDDSKIINVYEETLEIMDIGLYETMTKIKDDGEINILIHSYCEQNVHLYQQKIAYQKPIFVGGNLFSEDNILTYGGGLRVKSLIVNDGNKTRSTNYKYEEMSQMSSGTTSYEPYKLNKEILLFPDNECDDNYLNDCEDLKKQAVNLYRKNLYREFFETLAISREVPGPGVMYEYVTVEEKVGSFTLPNYITYRFEVFKRGLLDIIDTDGGISNEQTNGNYDNISYTYKNTRSIALKNYTSRIGNLKSVTLYNSNGTKVFESTNEYLNDGLDDSFDQNRTVYENRLKERFNNQGVIEETFSNARFVRYKKNDPLPYNDYIPGNDEYHLLGIISKKETFPSLLTGQTNINYKTGITTSSKNLAFDFYSGAVTKTLATDSYGNHYLSETQPAYRQYPAMGLKIENPDNKHMLTQNAATYLYKVNNETDITPTGLLTASIQTWSNATPILKYGSQPEIWRKEAGYTWDGQETLNTDGTYKMSDFSLHPFNWADPAGNTNWQKLTQITLYDHYSHALEAIDINGKYVATRMDYKQEKVIASAANASYHEMAFSGAEYNSVNATEEGGVLKGDGNAVFNQGHTGDYALLVSPGRTGFSYTIRGDKADLSKKYGASVWVYLPGEAETAAEIENVELFYTINGQEMKSVHPRLHKNKSKSWYLLNLDIDPSPGGDIVVSCRNNTSRAIYFDDFRVHPLDAAMNTYVYDQKTGELTYILDPHNIYTHYEYDALGRVIKVSRERLSFDFGDERESYKADQILKEIIYNSKRNN